VLKLKELPEVTSLVEVKNSLVPIIKLVISELDIDLLFARLAIKNITEEFSLMDDQLLKNVDAESILSLNGYRSTQKILECVPNKETFRVATKVIKVWAKKRGVYGNVFGFPNGVSYAILVA